MKGKIISLILVFVISFSLVSGSYQKKVEASSVVLGYAAFKAGIAFTGFAAYAGMLYANGYNMGIQEMIVGFANKYYDYSNGVYTAKGDKMNVLDKLNLATSSFLSGNDFLTYSELDAIKNDIIEEWPQKVDVSNLEPDLIVGSQLSSQSNFLVNDGNGFYYITSEYKDKIIKLEYNEVQPEYYMFVNTSNIEWVQKVNKNYPTIQFIYPNGMVEKMSLTNYSGYLQLGVNTTNEGIRMLFRTSSGTLNSSSWYYLNTLEDQYSTTSDSFADGSRDFIKSYPNYYSALSGKASTMEDLENLMNTDEYLQREISALIENQAVNTENQLEVPLVDGGVITYPDSAVTDPDVPYTPGSTWYDNLLDGVTSIPDLFIGKMTDLIDDKITPALESLKNTVLTIPDLISNIWQWILDFPDLLYSWFVPTAPEIAETWDPVMDLWDLKLDPIIAPFKNLTFYETEYQDISVPLKFGSYEKEHKIIDFQYIKSQRDTIKSLIRAFLWILIIFFNLDQIHRLIRNQSLLNTYVRKIDKGA